MKEQQPYCELGRKNSINSLFGWLKRTMTSLNILRQMREQPVPGLTLLLSDVVAQTVFLA